MRPLELRVRNFRSFFGDDYTFDFRDRHLLGIVGPIGAGKSTILDAIAFALYGRTPRIAQSTKSLIHQRADAAAVKLRFQVDDQIWEASRQLRKKGQSQHALYRYEEDKADAVEVEKIVLEREVNERIEELLGFDYDAFGRSVLLAQGQFAEFLNARPAERNKVLKGVFGHDRIDGMRDLAKVKVKDAEHDIEKLSIRLEHTEAAIGRLTGRKESLALSTKRLAALEQIQPEFEKLTGSVTAAEVGIKDSTSRLAELQSLAEKLPDVSLSEEQVAHAERARARRARLAEDLATAHKQATEAETEIKSDAFGERSVRFKQAAEMVVRLEAQQESSATAATQSADAIARVIASQANLGETIEALARAETADQKASAALVAAGHVVTAAEVVLTDARHADMAVSLRRTLVVDDMCPVCDQPVHDVPSVEGGADTDAVEKALESARSRRTSAELELRTATAAQVAAKAVQESADLRIGESDKEADALELARQAAADVVKEALGELESLIGKGEPGAQLELERLAIDQLGAKVEAARKGVEDIRRALDEAITVEQEADRSLGDLRTQLVALATQLDAEATVPEDDPAAMRLALDDLRDGWRSATDDLSASIDTDKAGAVADQGRLAELRADHDVEGSLADSLATVRAEIKVAQAEIEADENVVASSSDLLAEREKAEAVAFTYRRLSTDLTDAKFIRFLLDEERARWPSWDRTIFNDCRQVAIGLRTMGISK